MGDTRATLVERHFAAATLSPPPDPRPKVLRCMSVSVVLALGFALLGSLCLLAVTIHRRPTAAATPPAPQRNRFPIAGSGPVASRALHTPESLGEVEAAYRMWIESLDELNKDLETFSASSPKR